jgi:hypothetical protein
MRKVIAAVVQAVATLVATVYMWFSKLKTAINDRKDAFHFKVSLTKSGLRIFAGVGLIAGSLILAGVLLILAEALGVVEEI